MKLCTNCKKNPQTAYRNLCLPCIAKKNRKRYATDEDYRKRTLRSTLMTQRKRRLRDPKYVKRKLEYDRSWRKDNKEKYTYLQAKSAFNRLSSYYKKKLIKELKL